MDLLLENQSAASDVSVTKENWFEPIQISFELEAFDTANERLIPQLNWSGLAIMNSSYVPAPFDYLDSTNQSTEDDDQLQKNHSSPYLMPWPQQSAWITIFTLMLIVATVGNALVAWIVLGTLTPLCKLPDYITKASVYFPTLNMPLAIDHLNIPISLENIIV